MPDFPTIGPPVPGAPWTRLFPFPRQGVGGTPSNRPPPPPVPPPSPGTGKDRPLLRRVPAPDDPNYARRVSEFSELLADAFNSLVRKGELVREGTADWSINAAGGTAVGVTGTFNSGSF